MTIDGKTYGFAHALKICAIRAHMREAQPNIKGFIIALEETTLRLSYIMRVKGIGWVFLILSVRRHLLMTERP